MENLHVMLRNLRGEAPRRDHLAVFREFLGHLDRIGKRGNTRARDTKSANGARKNSRRGKR